MFDQHRHDVLGVKPTIRDHVECAPCPRSNTFVAVVLFLFGLVSPHRYYRRDELEDITKSWPVVLPRLIEGDLQKAGRLGVHPREHVPGCAQMKMATELVPQLLDVF